MGEQDLNPGLLSLQVCPSPRCFLPTKNQQAAGFGGVSTPSLGDPCLGRDEEGVPETLPSWRTREPGHEQSDALREEEKHRRAGSQKPPGGLRHGSGSRSNGPLPLKARRMQPLKRRL